MGPASKDMPMADVNLPASSARKWTLALSAAPSFSFHASITNLKMQEVRRQPMRSMVWRRRVLVIDGNDVDVGDTFREDGIEVLDVSRDLSRAGRADIAKAGSQRYESVFLIQTGRRT